MSGSAVHVSAEINPVGAQHINSLINSIDLISNRLTLSQTAMTGAVGYAEVGGVVEDGALDGVRITDTQFMAYSAARQDVLDYDYAVAETAQQLFTQEHTAAMNNLSIAVDTLTDATSVLAMATSVSAIAQEADTKPEQVALQGMLATDEFTITEAKVDAYNEAVGAVEGYAQQAGAFMAAANNDSLTASINNYAAQNGIVVGSYTAITYTQSIDEFVISWDETGYGTGWNGYLTNDMKSAEDVYGAGAYISQYGSATPGM